MGYNDIVAAGTVVGEGVVVVAGADAVGAVVIGAVGGGVAGPAVGAFVGPGDGDRARDHAGTRAGAGWLPDQA